MTFDDDAGLIRNKYYESDIEYDLGFNRTLLRVVGIWPVGASRPIVEKIQSKVAIIGTTLLLAFFFFPNGSYIFLIENDLGLRLKMLGPFSLCTMTILKYVIVFARKNDLKKCIDQIIADWREIEEPNHRSIMLRNARVCRHFTKLCVVFMFSGSLFYTSLLPLVSKSQIISNPSMTDNHTTKNRPLPFPSHFFVFDPQLSPAYEIVYVGHVVSIVFICTVVTGLCSLAVKFVLHGCSRFQIVIDCLDRVNTKGDPNSSDFDRQLAEVVEKHVRAITYVRHVETVLSEFCLVEVVGSTLCLCLLGHYILMEWENNDAIATSTYSMILTSYTFNIFVFCYIGELITMECRLVGERAHMTKWYRLPGKKALNFMLTIAVSQHPETVTAGRMIELSLRSFANVVRTAVAYLNLLRKVTSS